MFIRQHVTSEDALITHLTIININQEDVSLLKRVVWLSSDLCRPAGELLL